MTQDLYTVESGVLWEFLLSGKGQNEWKMNRGWKGRSEN